MPATGIRTSSSVTSGLGARRRSRSRVGGGAAVAVAAPTAAAARPPSKSSSSRGPRSRWPPPLVGCGRCWPPPPSRSRWSPRRRGRRWTAAVVAVAPGRRAAASLRSALGRRRCRCGSRWPPRVVAAAALVVARRAGRRGRSAAAAPRRAAAVDRDRRARRRPTAAGAAGADAGRSAARGRDGLDQLALAHLGGAGDAEVGRPPVCSSARTMPLSAPPVRRRGGRGRRGRAEPAASGDCSGRSGVSIWSTVIGVARLTFLCGAGRWARNVRTPRRRDGQRVTGSTGTGAPTLGYGATAEHRRASESTSQQGEAAEHRP